MVSPRFSYMISNHREAYASVNVNSPPKLLRVRQSRDCSDLIAEQFERAVATPDVMGQD
jgi:hypothetical protein